MYKNHDINWYYIVVPETCRTTDLGKFNTYGIQITGLEYEDVFHDVSVYKEVVSWMVDLFNRHQLSPIHLKDAVEDLLT